MAEPTDKPDTNFLRRWSQRKLAAEREVERPAEGNPVVPAAAPAQPPAAAPVADPPGERADESQAPQLPDVASLTFDSDYKAFLAPGVDEGTRRAALRKLFADPHFNTMDGLDVYIDDYSKFEPVTPEILKQLAHVRYLFDPPKTRVNEQGYVEDVPAEPSAAGEPATDDATQADAADPALPQASQASPALTPVDSPVPPEAAPGTHERSR